MNLWNFEYLWIINAYLLFIVLHKIALGLIDYLAVVKTPMDLGTVKKKLKNNKYSYIEEFLNDI